MNTLVFGGKKPEDQAFAIEIPRLPWLTHDGHVSRLATQSDKHGDTQKNDALWRSNSVMIVIFIIIMINNNNK